MKTLFQVLDVEQQPVPNALLSAKSVENGDWQALTDVMGEFTADLAPGLYTVAASKDGITSLEHDVQVGAVRIILQPPTPIPPSPGEDAVDLSKAVFTVSSPDVSKWLIGAKLTSLFLDMVENANVDFTKRWGSGAWPFVEGPEGGDIQYTLWVGCLINGLWYFCGSILCISRGEDDNYVPTGPTLEPGQLPNNWYYFSGPPLYTYQPKPGEKVAWFLTSGVQRRNDMHIIQERTQVVLTPFSPGTYTF